MNNRVKKENIAVNVENMFANCESVFIIKNSTMKSVASQNLRKKLKEVGGEVKVVKNTILRVIANKNDSIKKLEPFFEKQISLVFANKNTQGVASLIKSSGYSEKIIDVTAGMYVGQVFGKEKFEFISNIPSANVLYARLCGVLLSPIAILAATLNEVAVKNNDINKEESLIL